MVDVRERDRVKTRTGLYLLFLVLFVSIDFLPVLKLGEESPLRVRALAVPAGVLGASLAIWVWRWLLRSRPRHGSRGLGRLASIAAVGVLIMAIRAAPTGVQMIYSSTLEGFLCALLVLAVRVRLSIRRARITDDA